MAASSALQQDSPCPPCTVPVPKSCHGQHCRAYKACCSSAAFACGAPCSRQLPCGNHTCTLPCHPIGVSSLTDKNPAAFTLNMSACQYSVTHWCWVLSWFQERCHDYTECIATY